MQKTPGMFSRLFTLALINALCTVCCYVAMVTANFRGTYTVAMQFWVLDFSQFIISNITLHYIMTEHHKHNNNNINKT